MKSHFMTGMIKLFESIMKGEEYLHITEIDPEPMGSLSKPDVVRIRLDPFQVEPVPLKAVDLWSNLLDDHRNCFLQGIKDHRVNHPVIADQHVVPEHFQFTMNAFQYSIHQHIWKMPLDELYQEMRYWVSEDRFDIACEVLKRIQCIEKWSSIPKKITYGNEFTTTEITPDNSDTSV